MPPAWPNIFVIGMLTRDLYAVANLFVISAKEDTIYPALSHLTIRSSNVT